MDRQIVQMPIAELHLDPNNPRFGAMAGKFTNESEILDFIVSQFGVDDVISSMAVNGYFTSEPLLAKSEKGKPGFTVAEGNRRLAAAMIIIGDPRAKNQKRRHAQYSAMHKKYGEKQIDPVAVVRFSTKEDLKALVPYLGVRHIAGAQEWDSYAKAAWVAQSVEVLGLNLDDVIHMIGDSTQLAKKMLMGYYVVQQLIDAKLFDPGSTTKKGSRSNTEFPFSWVYTAIGYSSIQEFMGLEGEPKRAPIPRDHLEASTDVFTWMFGQGSTSPAIAESREIGDLAKVLASPEPTSLLRNGLTVREVKRKSRPPVEQVSDALTRAHENLAIANTLLGEGAVTSADAEKCLQLGIKVRRLSATVYRELEKSAGLDDEGTND